MLHKPLKVNKIASILVCCIIIAMVILNGFFMVTHGEHHCTGSICHTCETLYFAQSLQKQLESTIVFTGFITLLLSVSRLCNRRMFHLIFLNISLVDQKIRMNN